MLSWAQKKAIADISYSSSSSIRLLEIGFGDAEVLDLLSLHNYAKVSGLEVSSRLVHEARVRLASRANTHITIEDGTVLKPSMNYDTILAFEVLEHQSHPLEFLRKLPGYRLYLSTPNIGRWFVRRFADYEYWDWPPNHLWRFCSCPSEESTGLHESCIQGCPCTKFSEAVPQVHIETLLTLAGYNDIQIEIPPVQAIDIVRAISGKIRPKKLSSNYDEMRSESSLVRSIARNVLLPPATIYAKYLSSKEYQGGNMYVRATRDYK